MDTKLFWRVLAYSLCLALVATMGVSCAKSDEVIEPDLTRDTTPPVVEPPAESRALPEVDLEKLLFDRNSDSGLKLVYFDFDKSDLRPDALAALSKNADLIKQVPGVIIQIAGHCDERGTQEYNLALGERRALSVRNHLINLGISGDRMITISYGEEDPAAPGHDEAAWSKNRRCEFNKAQSQ